jgi:hypothetical protein
LPPPGPLEASEASPRDLKSRLRPNQASRQQIAKPDLCAGDCCSKVRFLFGLDP